MSDRIQEVENQYGQKMVDATAAVLVDDARSMIENGEALAFPASENSPVIAVRPLRAETIRIKRERGYARPALPRFRTGELLQSIRAEYGQLTDTVVAGADYADEQQYGWPSNGVNLSTPRPFFGVSDRALKAATVECEKLKQQLVAALNADDTTIQAGATITA